MNALLTAYEAEIATGAIIDSVNQRHVLSQLQVIADHLLVAPHKKHWWSWSDVRLQGLYLYGPVGTGKTHLMDLFYNAVPNTRKARFHFHQWMQKIDELLRRKQGCPNPLKQIAKSLASDIQLLCLDEFLVEDVAHASILAALLAVLFQEGIVLVATANTKPEDLYLEGLHRERFVPAIDLIKQHCQVIYLDDHRDYRIGHPVLAEAYFFPADPEQEANMLVQFIRCASGAVVEENGLLNVQTREVAYIRKAGRVIWFAFDVICNLPRSQLDYLEIAERFDTVFVSQVPAIADNEPARMILFIRFVDVMYDARIRLILLAQVPIELIYVKGPMKAMFERTLSRLREMQSADYLKNSRHKLI